MLSIKDLPRSTKRSTWRALWRQVRIINREASKAALDTMLFGIGFCRVGSDVPDLIEHVAAEKVYIDLATGVASVGP